MAAATKDNPETETQPKPKVEKVPSDFRVFVRPLDAETYTLIGLVVSATYQDEAKRKVARQLAEDETYGPVIQGQGLEIAVVSARSWKPVQVKVEPQPAKVVIK